MTELITSTKEELFQGGKKRYLCLFCLLKPNLSPILCYLMQELADLMWSDPVWVLQIKLTSITVAS